ncbi:GNAT family N-acetyltransferase [Patescibacteria group bacterium]|nr:GNAT family N-acetyltransferase [Patescibacteria group bacterium]
MKKIIKGQGFTLRPFNKTDYKILAKKINHRDIYRHTLNIPYPYRESDAKKFLNKILNEYKKKESDGYHLAVIIDDEIAGSVGLMKIERGHKAEIGYWLAKDHWGKGIMPLTIKKIVTMGFRDFKLKKIYAYVMVANRRSYQVLIKNGFKKEGLLIQHVKKDGKLKDEYILGKYKNRQR